ncbi:MAG: GNAT family protein [Chloroflexota bacterium]
MIYGDGIRLRAPEKEDLPRFVAWLNDPEVRENLSMYLPLSMAQEEQWFEKMLKQPPETQPLVIEVQEKDDWIPIGNMGVFDHQKISHSGELGIMIGNKAYWNKGFGTRSIQLMLRHCFETLNLNRVSLIVFQTNPRAIRCYEKVGFVHEGKMREAHYKNGKYIDVLMMSVLASEWSNSSSSRSE